MKKSLVVHTSELGLPGRKTDAWFDRFRNYLPEVDELILKQVEDEDRIEYGEDLARAAYRLEKFLYLVRKERDQALAVGYEKYPKPAYNSDAGAALARQYASEEIRLRGLVEGMMDAISQRYDLNRTAEVSHRARTQNAG